MPQYELNLRDYLQIIRKRRIILVIVFFVVLIPTIIITHMQSPLYQASASVQWVERRSVGDLLTELVTVTTGDPLLTQSRVIQSQPVLERAVAKLGLAGKDASDEKIAEIAQSFPGAVSTEVIRDTNIIRIEVTYPVPKLAADIANAIVDVYLEVNLEEKNKQSRLVREFIEKQLGELNAKLKNSEDVLARFKEAEIPSGIALPLQNRLAELEAKRRDLLSQYTQLHPDVKNIEEEIARAKEQLKTLPQKELEYSRLDREVEINTKLYKELKDKLEAARITEAEKIGDVSRVDSAVTPASPVSPNKKANYFLGAVIGLMLGMAGAFMVEQMDTSIGTIEDVENYIGLPVLGVIPYLRTKEDEKKNIIQRLWPKELKGEDRILRMRKQLLIHYSGSSPISEAYKILRTKLQNEVFKEGMKQKIILSSSSGPEEGKSMTISNLALVMAQAGLRTILVDADMRRSTIHKIYGLKKREPGLCDVLRGTAKLGEAIRTFTDLLMGEIGYDEALKLPGIDNLNILPSGSLPQIPAELLMSPQMPALLEELKNKFDLVLVDTPPVLAVADASILAKFADAIILIYRVGMVSRSILARTKQQITEAGGQVKGIVLNNISPEMEMRYGYYYHYKYYGKYYTTSPEKSIKEAKE